MASVLSGCLGSCLAASDASLESCVSSCYSDAGWQSPPSSTEVLWCGFAASVCVALSAVVACIMASTLGMDQGTVQEALISGKQEEQKKAKAVEGLRHQSGVLLSALLLTTSALNVAATALLIRVTGYLLGGVIAFVLLILLTELLPPGVCNQRSLSVAAATAWLAWLCLILLFPLAWPLSVILSYLVDDHRPLGPPPDNQPFWWFWSTKEGDEGQLLGWKGGSSIGSRTTTARSSTAGLDGVEKGLSSPTLPLPEPQLGMAPHQKYCEAGKADDKQTSAAPNAAPTADVIWGLLRGSGAPGGDAPPSNHYHSKESATFERAAVSVSHKLAEGCAHSPYPEGQRSPRSSKDAAAEPEEGGPGREHPLKTAPSAPLAEVQSIRHEGLEESDRQGTPILPRNPPGRPWGGMTLDACDELQGVRPEFCCIPLRESASVPSGQGLLGSQGLTGDGESGTGRGRRRPWRERETLL